MRNKLEKLKELQWVFMSNNPKEVGFGIFTYAEKNKNGFIIDKNLRDILEYITKYNKITGRIQPKIKKYKEQLSIDIDKLEKYLKVVNND